MGIDWPASDLILFVLLAAYALAGLAAIWLARRVLDVRRSRTAPVAVA